MLGGLSDGQAAAIVSGRFLSGQLQQLVQNHLEGGVIDSSPAEGTD